MQSQATNIITGLLVAVLVVVSVLAALYLFNRSSDSSPTVQQEEERTFSIQASTMKEGTRTYEPADPEESLGGTIYLTIPDPAHTPVVQGLTPIRLYEYKPGTGQEPTVVPETDFISDTVDVQEQNDIMVYGKIIPEIKLSSTTVAAVPEQGATYRSEIFVFNGSEETQISSSTTYADGPAGQTIARKRTPKLANNSQEVIYDTQVADPNGGFMSNMQDLNTWHILKTNVGSKEDTYLTQGAHGVWSKDDAFIFFIRADGVYAKRMDSEEGEEQLILPSPSEFSGLKYASHLQISHDGRYLVLNATELAEDNLKLSSSVQIYEIGGGAEFPETELVEEINTEYGGALWPVFSPGGRYLALHLLESTGSERIERKQERIAVYDFVTESIVDQISIEHLSSRGSIFMTDWSAL